MAFLGTSGNPLEIVGNITSKTYEKLLNNNALWLQNVASVAFKVNWRIDIPLPILGFIYQPISDLEILSYEYSKSPYLNKSQIATSYIKNNTNISVQADKAITNINKMPINIIYNAGLIPLLEYYANQGGLFALATPYGVFRNLALKRLVGTSSDNAIYGSGLLFEFEKLNIASSGESKIKESLDKTQEGVL